MPASFRRIALVLLTITSTGCPSFQKPAFNRDEGANGATVLLVPFRESKKRLWYGESRRGNQVELALKDWARRNADDPLFLEGSDARRALYMVTEWRGEGDDIPVGDWRTVSGGLFKYAVVGDIISLKLRKGGVIGVFDGEVRAHIRVINAESGVLTYEAPKRVTYGGGKEMTLLDTPSSENDARVEQRLLAKLAEEIGKDLYGYYGE